MTIPNDPPNSCLSHSQPQPLTTYRSPLRSTYNLRPSHMIPLQLYPAPGPRPGSQHTHYVSVMAGHCTRKHLPRTPHANRTKRSPIRNNPFYCLRSILFRWLLLSLLSLKLSPHSRTRRMLTTYRHHSTEPS